MNLSRIPWYIIATLTLSASNFLTTLLLVNIMSAEEFARWALIEPLMHIGASVATIGTQYGMIRFIASGSHDRRTTYRAVLFVLISVSAILFVLSTPFYVAYFGIYTAILLFSSQVTESLASTSSAALRALRRGRAFALFEGGRSVILLLVLSAAGLFQLSSAYSASDFLLNRAIVMSLFCVISLLFIFHSTPAYNSTVIPLVSYGLPIFLGQLAIQFALNADRYIFVLAGLPAESLTQYVVHSRVAGLIGIVVLSPLALSYPAKVANSDQTGASDGLARAAEVAVLAASLPLVLCATFLVGTVWPLVFPGVVLDRFLIAALSFGVVMQALAVAWNVGALRPGHTRWNTLPPVLSLVVVVALGYPLTAHFGVAGAAASKMLALCVYAFAFLLISLRITRQSDNKRHLLWFFLSAVIILAAALPGSYFLPSGVFAALTTWCIGIYVNRLHIRNPLL